MHGRQKEDWQMCIRGLHHLQDVPEPGISAVILVWARRYKNKESDPKAAFLSVVIRAWQIDG